MTLAEESFFGFNGGDAGPLGKSPVVLGTTFLILDRSEVFVFPFFFFGSACCFGLYGGAEGFSTRIVIGCFGFIA